MLTQVVLSRVTTTQAVLTHGRPCVCYQVLDRATSGAPSSSAVAAHVEAIMRASGIAGKLSVSHLNQLCLSIQDREAWLAQPKVREMVAEDRVAKLSLMISNEQKSVGRPARPTLSAFGGVRARSGSRTPDTTPSTPPGN